MHWEFVANDGDAHQHTGVASCCWGRPWGCCTRIGIETTLDSWFLAEDLCVVQWHVCRCMLYLISPVDHWCVQLTFNNKIQHCFITNKPSKYMELYDTCSNPLKQQSRLLTNGHSGLMGIRNSLLLWYCFLWPCLTSHFNVYIDRIS